MNRLVVLDASAALEAVLRRNNAERVLDIVEGAQRVSAPELFAAEVANALWKHVRAGDIDSDEAHLALEYSLDLVDCLESSVDLAAEALATSSAHHHPVYDALYAVLARRSGATVCTFDRRLTKFLDVMLVPFVIPRG